MDDCLEQLTALTPVATGTSSESVRRHTTPPIHDDRSSRAHRSRLSIFATLCLLLLTAAAVWFWTQQRTTEALVVGAVALIVLLLQAFRPRYDRIPQEDDWSEDEDHPYETDDLRVHRLRRRMDTLQQQYEAICRQEWDHDHLLEQAQTLEEELEQLALLRSQEDEIRLEIQAIALAISTLQKLSDQMQDDIGPRLGEEMSRILAGLTDGVYTKVFVDGQLHVSVQGRSCTDPTTFSTDGLSASLSRTIPLESLSRGTIEQVYLAMRLAVIDLLFPQGGMPLILDDCFLTYDDDRLTATLSWLAENYSGQVLIFTCQKREAALLHKEQIPFTHIVL